MWKSWWGISRREAGVTDRSEVLWEKGVRLSDEGRYREAAGAYTEAAEMGHVLAQTNLGTLLFDKLDPPEVEKAIYWSEKAAEAGERCAAWNLAMHYRDLGDATQYKIWMLRAGELGDDDAKEAVEKPE